MDANTIKCDYCNKILVERKFEGYKNFIVNLTSNGQKVLYEISKNLYKPQSEEAHVHFRVRHKKGKTQYEGCLFNSKGIDKQINTKKH